VKSIRVRLLRIRVLQGPHAHQLVGGRVLRPALWPVPAMAMPVQAVRSVHPFGGLVGMELHWHAHFGARFPQALGMVGTGGGVEPPSEGDLVLAGQVVKGLRLSASWSVQSTADDVLQRAPYGLRQRGVGAVWERLRELAHVPMEARCVAWRVMHGALYCGAFRMRVNTQCTLQEACCGVPGCEGALQGLSHMFVTCPGVMPAVAWLGDVWYAIAGERPPLVASVLLADDRSVWRPDAPVALLWSTLRVMFLYSVFRCLRGGTVFQSASVCARAVVATFVRQLRDLIVQDWGRVVSKAPGRLHKPLSCAEFELRWCHGGVLAEVREEPGSTALGELHVKLSCGSPAVPSV
jgi:hypothetical protein